MKLPGVPADFQLPEDPGELLAWMKNFATKLPQYAERLGVSAVDLAMVQITYEQMRAAKEAEDQARLKAVEHELCKVPDGWPPPPVLGELIRQIPSMEEPQRTRMLEEVERWSGSIARAGSPQPAPKLRGGYSESGIRLRTELPGPCRWSHFYYRQAGAAAWRLLAITAGDFHFFTDPESREEEEKLQGDLEFVALGLLPHQDPQHGWGDAWGAPSAVLTMAVPTEYPVPAALIDK